MSLINGKTNSCSNVPRLLAFLCGQVGHMIPYSILQKVKGKISIDVVRGVPISSRHMGYRVFCPDCKKRFSDGGEKVFAPGLGTRLSLYLLLQVFCRLSSNCFQKIHPPLSTSSSQRSWKRCVDCRANWFTSRNA